MTLNVPDAPVLTVAAGNATNTLTWTTPNGNGATITGYTIYRSLSPGTEVALVNVGVVNTYANSGLTNGTVYYYKVAALYTVGTSGTGVVSGETSGAPVAPTSPGALDTPGVAARLIEWCGKEMIGNRTGIPKTLTQLQTFNTTCKAIGLAMNLQHLWGMGGQEQWTSNIADPLSGSAHVFQQTLRDTSFMADCRAVGLTKLYLGCYARNAPDHNFWGDWWDDALWTTTVIPAITNFAAAAKNLGFDGLIFDNEGSTEGADWAWNYPGNIHDQPTTRVKVKARGAQMMTAILSVFPNVEVGFYNMNMPGSLKALRDHINTSGSATRPWPGGWSDSVQFDWLNGFSSVPGYSRLRMWDDGYYTGIQISGAVFPTTLQATLNAELAYFSQHLDNWSYASQRIDASPFLWIGPTVSTAESHLSPASTTAAGIPAAARKYGMSGEFANYLYTNSDGPDQNPSGYTAYSGVYGTFVSGTVDTTNPTLSGITITRRGSTGIVDAIGTADDDLGIRSVRWTVGTNSGACIHTYVPESTLSPFGTALPDYTKAEGLLGWHATFTTIGTAGIPAASGQMVQFTVEDIKGRTASYSVMAGTAATVDPVDGFIRTNNANISVNAPFAYTVDAGTLAIASNVCVVSTTTHAYALATGLVPASANEYAQITISTFTEAAASNLQVGVTCRNVSATATRYEADVKSTSTTSRDLRLHAVVAGVDTILGTYALAAKPVAGDTLKLACIGTAITVYFKGVSRIAVTNSAVNGSTVGGKQCGFHMLESVGTVQTAISEFRFGVA